MGRFVDTWKETCKRDKKIACQNCLGLLETSLGKPFKRKLKIYGDAYHFDLNCIWSKFLWCHPFVPDCVTDWALVCWFDADVKQSRKGVEQKLLLLKLHLLATTILQLRKRFAETWLKIHSLRIRTRSCWQTLSSCHVCISSDLKNRFILTLVFCWIALSTLVKLCSKCLFIHFPSNSKWTVTAGLFQDE